MIPLLLAFRGLARAIDAVWRDPETKALPSMSCVSEDAVARRESR
jgi:hypothetical protein